MAKDKIQLECRGLVFHYRFGERWFECRHSLTDNIVFILSGTSPVFTGELQYTSAVDSKIFFDHWLATFIDSLKNPFG